LLKEIPEMKPALLLYIQLDQSENLYFYQIEHEAKYLWKKKEEIFEKFKSTNPIIENINNYVDTLIKTDFEFQIPNTSEWIIGNERSGKLKQKIDFIGKPLKDFKITINFGIKTGYNEAFIIDEQIKNSL
jgi:hypothetical protein